jgi:DNA repair protein RecN (Recombination protein N)
MLKTLIIKNYALIDNLEIDFPEGFTVITGETGAGKSILIGALGLLLGNRADASAMGNIEKKCNIEGVFDLEKLNLEPFFQINDLDYEKVSILRREIIPPGKSRAFINDTPVNLNILKELGDQLVDIHSQHETLLLNKASFQLNVLDDFIDVPEKMKFYRDSYSEFILLERKLNQLILENENSKKDNDYINFQLNELEAAALHAGESEHLQEREKLLAHAEEVLMGIETANKILDNEEQSLLEQLQGVKENLRKIEPYLSGLSELTERLQSLEIELKDIVSEINSLDTHAEFDPSEMQRITERLDLLYKLQQKHHAQSVDELIQIRIEYEMRIQHIVLLDEEVKELEMIVKSKKEELLEIAEQLHDRRLKAAPAFSTAIVKLLAQMGIRDAIFQVKVEQTQDLNENGQSKITFLFTANKGNPPGEIAKIASGGELSRLMLAIKSLLTKEHVFPTVIFDEIDAGVSGDIAGKVGNVMKKMSEHHQLIAISHLPQIASKATHQKKVFKITEHNTTRSEIETLDETGRVEEIAKMLSDEKVTESAIKTARELMGI